MTSKDKPATKSPAIRDLEPNEIDSTSGGAATRTPGWIEPDIDPVRNPKGPGWIDPEVDPAR